MDRDCDVEWWTDPRLAYARGATDGRAMAVAELHAATAEQWTSGTAWQAGYAAAVNDVRAALERQVIAATGARSWRQAWRMVMRSVDAREARTAWDAAAALPRPGDYMPEAPEIDGPTHLTKRNPGC